METIDSELIECSYCAYQSNSFRNLVTHRILVHSNSVLSVKLKLLDEQTGVMKPRNRIWQKIIPADIYARGYVIVPNEEQRTVVMVKEEELSSDPPPSKKIKITDQVNEVSKGEDEKTANVKNKENESESTEIADEDIQKELDKLIALMPKVCLSSCTIFLISLSNKPKKQQNRKNPLLCSWRPRSK